MPGIGGGLYPAFKITNMDQIADGVVAESKMLAAASQTITANNETIAHGGAPVVLLTVNEAGDGDIVLGDTEPAVADGTIDGQQLTLIVDTVTDGQLKVKDGGSSNLTLSGDWQPDNQNEASLHLRWNATDSTWWEVGRAYHANTDSGELAGSAGGIHNNNTGFYAGSAGGQSNVNSGLRAGSVGGQLNVNSGTRTGSAGGYGGKCRHQAESLAAAYKRSAAGDAQATNYLLRTTYAADANEHSGPSWHEMVTPERWVLEADTVVGFTVTIVGRKDNFSTAAMFKRMVLLLRSGNDIFLAGAAQTIGTDIKSDANWDVQITADDTNESIKIEVHAADGDSGDTVHWTAYIQPVVG